jgi:protein-S-isoprenylcysteine O-methyltransferase Ste14
MWLAPGPDAAPLWRVALAIVAFLLAGVIGLPALRAFRRADTTIDPVRIDRASVLVTSGIYRVSRNPMYVSLTLMLVAWALWLGGPWVSAGPVLLALWLDRFQIRPEERIMSARFGADYDRYRTEVRRWL